MPIYIEWETQAQKSGWKTNWKPFYNPSPKKDIELWKKNGYCGYVQR